MAVIYLASLGGLISFLSTALGSLLSLYTNRSAKGNRFSLTIDFALGLMVSASAFTLIGPSLVDSDSKTFDWGWILAAAFAGVLLILLFKKALMRLQTPEKSYPYAQILLASVLMLHNFPEGLASGAALGGLGWSASWPILGGISIQNVPEGALMVLCLRAMGWSPRNAFLGGIASGLVEMFGGVLAGLLLQWVQGVLSLLLSFAGGAMMASVLVEIGAGAKPITQRVFSQQFLVGFALLPLVQFLTL